MYVNTSKDILGSVLKTAQMGQVGIRAVTPFATNKELKKALHDQLAEYNSIEASAKNIASINGWHLKQLNPMTKIMSEMYTKTNLSFGDVDSKIAAMMVQGNTRGIIKGLKNKHHCVNAQEQVLAISQRLMDTEESNIKQMQGFI